MEEQPCTASGIAHNEPVVLPRLGGRRPRYADAAAWCIALCLAIVSARPFSLLGIHFLPPYGWVLAALLGPCWSLWRFGSYSERLADVSLRRELALAGVSGPEFLSRQLRGDAAAAFGPLILPVLGTFLGTAMYVLWRLCTGNWHTSIVMVFLCGEATLALTASVLISATGALWLLSGRCGGAGSAGITARASLTLLAAYAGLFYVFVTYHRSAVTQLCELVILGGLFLAAAQIRVRTPAKDNAALTPARLCYCLSIGGTAAIAAWWLYFSLSAWTRPPTHMWDWSGELSVAGMCAAFSVAGMAGLAMKRHVAHWEGRAVWPSLAVGALATAAGIWFARPDPYLIPRASEIMPRQILQGFAVALPVAGMALLAARRPRSCSLLTRVMLVFGQACATMAGVLLGLAILVLRHEAASAHVRRVDWACMAHISVLWLILMIGLCVLVAARYTSRRSADPVLQVLPLVLGTVGLLAIDVQAWIPNETLKSQALPSWQILTVLVSATAAYGLWQRVQRCYFTGL